MRRPTGPPDGIPSGELIHFPCSRNAVAAVRRKGPKLVGLLFNQRIAQGNTLSPRFSTGRGREKTRAAPRDKDNERSVAARRRRSYSASSSLGLCRAASAMTRASATDELAPCPPAGVTG